LKGLLVFIADSLNLCNCDDSMATRCGRTFSTPHNCHVADSLETILAAKTYARFPLPELTARVDG